MSYSKNIPRSISWRFTALSDFGPVAPSAGHVDVLMTKSGSAIPRFRSIIKSGGIATSIYALVDALNENSKEIYPFGYVFKGFLNFPADKPLVESAAGTFIGNLPPSGSVDFSATANQALTNFYKTLSQQQTEFRGLQFLGELRETIHMLRHPFQGARTLVEKYMDTVRKNAIRYRPRRSLPSRRKFEKAIADSWLETAFGLRPFLSDVEEAAKAAKQFLYDNSKRDRIASSSKRPISGSENHYSIPTGTQTINLLIDEMITVEQSCKFLATVDWNRFAAPIGSFSRLQELAGFRLDLFVPTLYELAPWSFLVDYFSNLGTVIETGCMATSHITFVQRNDRVKSTLIGTASGKKVGSFKGSLSGSPGRYQIVRTSFFRTPLGNTVPNVQLSVSIPGSPTKYLNMLALWRSKVKDV